MNCHETVTVNAKSVNWLKEKYPELCIKAGLCERIAGRLYTKTFTTPPAQPAPVQEPVAQYSDIVSDGGLDPRNKFDTTPPAAQRQWVEVEQIKWDGDKLIAKLKKENT